VTWFTAADLGHLFGWSPAYVRKLASIHGWRKVGRAPIHYHGDDVLDYRSRTRPRSS